MVRLALAALVALALILRKGGGVVDERIERKAFLTANRPLAALAEARYSIPADFILAAAAHESDWGRSALARGARNFFGFKPGRSWSGPTFKTGDGLTYRSYRSAADSFMDYARLIATAPRYAKSYALALQRDPAYFEQVKRDGYTGDPPEDPAYGDKLAARFAQVRALEA